MEKNSTGTVIANILQTGAVVQVSPYGVHSVNEMVTIGAYPAGPVTIVGSGNSSVANAVFLSVSTIMNRRAKTSMLARWMPYILICKPC